MLIKNGPSLFQLLYSVRSRIHPSDFVNILKSESSDYRSIELLALLEPQVARADAQKKEKGRANDGKMFLFGQLVLVTYGDVFKEVKCPLFETKVYEPCKVIHEKHPFYTLLSGTANSSRVSVHARRLFVYRSERDVQH